MSTAHEGPMYRLGWTWVIFGALSLPVALISALAMAVAGMGLGPFATFPVEFTQFLLFMFLALGSLSGLLLAQSLKAEGAWKPT